MLLDPLTAAGRAGLRALLSAPQQAVLAADFDGTLAPIVARPEDARPAAGAIDALRALSGLVGRIVIVTGRSVDDVRRITGVAGDPALRGLVVLGHYGLERWSVGADSVDRPAPSPGLSVVRRDLPSLIAGRLGVTIEDKHQSLAVHTRGAADPGGTLAELRPALLALAERCGLEAVPGRFVLEIRPPGIDKGTALRAFVAEADTSCVVFCGDDLGDLPAFAAVEDMRRGGLPGLTVASASEEAPQVAAAADGVVDGPTGVVQFLTRLAVELAVGGERGE